MLNLADEFGARLSQHGVAIAILLSLATAFAAAATPGTPEAAQEAYAVFAGAEDRFQPTVPSRFDATQQALKFEVDRVSHALDSHRAVDAEFWKAHLRWELLERNLGPAETVDLSELQQVRRWMYSNRKGLESEFFAPLRSAMDAYLDAASTVLQRDLRAAFDEQVATARRQCLAIADDPSDANAASLGRTLGWFEQTGQLAREVAAVRLLTSLPNAQVIVEGELISRIVATQASAIAETIPLSEQVRVQPSNPLQRSRTMGVRGTATTRGDIQIKLTPNDRVAEVALVYRGLVESTARGETGPVILRIAANGTAEAVKPVYFGPEGLELGETVVTPQVASRVTGVSADGPLAEWVARRRVDQDESRSQMNAKARSTTVKQLSARFDQRVEEAVAKIRGDFGRLRSSLSEFGDVTAPLTREGVEFAFGGARSTSTEIELNAFARRREQHGAAAPCPHHSIVGDVVVRVHVSLFNNMAETITGGKTLSDLFIMKYAKVVHAELPLPLMVHSRAPRWALTMAKHRPLEMRTPEANRFAIVVRIDSVDIDGVTSTGDTTAVINYRLVQDEFGEYRLERVGGVHLESTLPSEVGLFVREKLGAFFGPVLSSGGVVIPEGGLLGALRGLQSKGVHAEREWIVAGWDVPSGVVDELIKSQQEQDNSSSPQMRGHPVALQGPSTSRE